MANFIPEQEKYKELTPFKLHCLTQFPYIDADFDALTNWELLCKVSDYLNNVIDNENKVENNVSGLYNAYVSLQGYVNDYFDNLDVQDEINNKLDAMAEDGSLYDIIKRYTDPIVEIQNSRISLIENKVNTATSGSPANTYPTLSALQSADPNHSRIYVVDEDGEWYFWNSSTNQWKNGGVYQSTGIADNSINTGKFDYNAINQLNRIDDTATNSLITETFINPNTTQADNVRFGFCLSQDTLVHSYNPKFTVNVGTYEWALYQSDVPLNANVSLTKIDSGIQAIGEKIVLNKVFTKNQTLLAIKSNAGRIMYCSASDKKFGNMMSVKTDESAVQNLVSAGISGELVTSTINIKTYVDTLDIWNFIEVSPNIFDKNASDVEHGCFYNNNQKVINANQNETGYIKVIPNTTYSFPTSNTYTELYDENKTYLRTTQTYASKTITMGNDVHYIRFAISNDNWNTAMIVKGTDYPTTYKPYGLIIKDFDLKSQWYDKKCVQIGDSITWYDGHTPSGGSEPLKGYASYLREIGLDVNNQGVSGACIALHSNSPYVDISSTVDDIDFSQYDIVTIAGGINDYAFWNSPMGTIINGTSGFDRTTFYGGYQYILNKILTDNPKIQILMFTPLKSYNNNYGLNNNTAGLKLIDYVNAIKNIAKLYSIPVLDLYEDGGFNRYTISGYTIDGLHPNNDGFKELSNKLISKINSL